MLRLFFEGESSALNLEKLIFTLRFPQNDHLNS